MITGGGSGIARFTARELAALGADVAIVGRNADQPNAVQAEIRSDGGRVSVHRPRNSPAALWNRGRSLRGGGVLAVAGRQVHHRDLHPCRRWSAERQARMVELQPARHNTPFDGFHRSALPTILGTNLPN
ncbi:SDR family NAD(P)-dependent oxidoreductase [Mycobacterium sp.]|uniref:SDR family NAD(P)-dependent oxidoreductase n=1 Tax=Mycobacterium sp. TaxID=1785 RepID=UPI0025D7C684|nr:SDR family NAD(P)-dependent oxidoreductase [Mycobacterium sp.]